MAVKARPPVEYGTTANPYQVRLPGWDDFIHVSPGYDMSAQQWGIAYGAKNDPDKLQAYFGEDQAAWIMDRIAGAEALRASPIPEVVQGWHGFLAAMDEIQDYLFIAQVATLPLAYAVPPVGLPILGFEASLSFGIDLVSYPLQAVGSARKRKSINGSGRYYTPERPQTLHVRGLQELSNMRSPWALLKATQAAETLTGIGTTIGQAFMLSSDLIWGTVRAAQGQYVVIPKQENESSIQRGARLGFNAYWSWLAGADLPISWHLYMALGTAVAADELGRAGRQNGLTQRIRDAQDWAIPSGTLWHPGTRELVRLMGEDPDQPILPPIDGWQPGMTFSDAADLHAARIPGMLREFGQRWGKRPEGELHSTLANGMIQITLGALTGEAQVSTPVWDEETGFLLAIAEKLPLAVNLHPAAVRCGLDAMLGWWRANRGTLTIPTLSNYQTARAQVTISRGMQEAFVPEVQRAGACPIAWLRHGHESTERGTPGGTYRLIRETTGDWGFNTLRAYLPGASNRLTIEPGNEAGLDLLTEAEATAAIRNGNINALCREKALAAYFGGAGQAPAGGGGNVEPPPAPYTSTTPAAMGEQLWGVPDDAPFYQFQAPHRRWAPPAATAFAQFMFDDRNWGVYGGSHPNGWEDGGPENNPFRNVAWGTRWGWLRNARITGVEMTELGRPIGIRAEQWRPNWVLRLLYEPDWDPFAIVLWGGPLATHPYTGVHWTSGYTPDRWLLYTSTDEQRRLDVPDGFRVPWLGDLALSVACYILHFIRLDQTLSLTPELASLELPDQIKLATQRCQRAIDTWRERDRFNGGPIYRPDIVLHEGPNGFYAGASLG